RADTPSRAAPPSRMRMNALARVSIPLGLPELRRVRRTNPENDEGWRRPLPNARAAGLASTLPSPETTMPAARRLLVVFLVLFGAFLVLVGFAVASLYTVGQPVLAAVVATAGLAGVGAGVLTYWLVKRDGIAEEFDFEIQIPTSTVAATESAAVANASTVVAEELATPEAATPAHVARRPRIVRRP